MTTIALLVLLLLLAIASVAAWHDAVSARLARLPWWLVVTAPAAVLGLAALLAAAGDGLPRGLAAVLGVVIAVAGGGPVTTAMLRGAELAGMPQITHPAEPAGPTVAGGTSPVPARPVLRGGLWIGALERAAIASCLLTGLAEGVALVLAVKSLGRYPELRAPGAAERFIIGTFTSLLWAAAAAGVALLLR
ncbi:hypothetical protein ABN028_07905 [Actinopolymorpha sp. B17G11]|uniref:hypothetical protein n=1 Tax=Actinopolymorpha sp. B17G11 TaxID=3160861 RepID=UPI0032E4E054